MKKVYLRIIIALAILGFSASANAQISLPYTQDFSALTAGDMLSSTGTTNAVNLTTTPLAGINAVTAAFQAGGVIKLATQSAAGGLTTDVINAGTAQYIKVSFKAVAWASTPTLKPSKVLVTYGTQSQAIELTAAPSNFPLNAASFSTYSVPFVANATPTPVVFSSLGVGQDPVYDIRFFMDDLSITPEPTITAPTDLFFENNFPVGAPITAINFYPIVLSDTVINHYGVPVVQDLRTNGTYNMDGTRTGERFFDIWSNTYLVNPSNGAGAFGQQGGYYDLQSQNLGWAGGGFNLLGSKNAAGVVTPPTPINLTAIDNTYRFHMCVRKTDTNPCEIWLGGGGNATTGAADNTQQARFFVGVGTFGVDSAQNITPNFATNVWNVIDIPVTQLRTLSNVKAGGWNNLAPITNGYYFAYNFGGNNINLQFDGIFFYKPVNNIIASGYCGANTDGKNLTWTLTADSVLTISGTGAMANYNSAADVPWYSQTANIKTLVVNNGVTTIGNYAFYGCSRLTGALTVPNSITSIGQDAFNRCSGLTSVTIPASVTSIGVAAFWGCTGLTAINVDVNNPNYTSDNGVLFNKNKTTLLYCLATKTGAYTVPTSVTLIKNAAFANCVGVTLLTIPTSVTIIEWDAFNGCSGLMAVTIPSSVTSIGYSAFADCTGLTDIYVSWTAPPSISSDVFYNVNTANVRLHTPATVGYYYYQNMLVWKNFQFVSITGPIVTSGYCGGEGDGKNLTWTISGYSPNYILTISGTGAMGNYGYSTGNYITYTFTQPPWYSNRTNIKTLVIDNGVTTICNYAFWGCNLTGAVTIPTSVTSIDHSAFYNCTGITALNFNAVNCTYMGSSFTIGWSPGFAYAYYAFTGCTNLTTLNIGSNVKNIPDGAFYGYSSFTGALTIPNSVTTIGNYAFSGCSGFTGLTIGNSVTSIRNNAFNSCSGFTGALTIPNSVTTIGNYAFLGCSGLTGNLTIPSSVTAIGDNAFSGCSGFTGALTIPNSVTTISVGTFSGCSGFTGALTIPNSITTIGNSAFSGCSGFTGALTIPNSVTSIGKYAFYNCSGFTTVTIPASVTSIGDYAFYGCSGITSVTNLNPAPQILGYYTFNSLMLSNLTLNVPCITLYQQAPVWQNFGTITGSNNSCPSLLNWEVGSPNASDVIATLNFNDSTLTISGTGAMQNLNRPQPYYNYLKYIKNIIISNSVTSIGDYAFYNCSGLTGTLTIPSSVTSIGNYAFAGCSALTSVTVPNSVTSIGSYAFSSCSGLTGTLTIPNSVTSISDNAFDGCWGLTSVTISNSVTSIGNYAFYSCSGFTGALTIPSSVTSIGVYAFRGCSSLTAINVDINNQNYSSDDGVLFNKDKTTLIQFPAGKQGTYTMPNSVSIIGDCAFYNCKITGSLTIPNSVTSIGVAAFYYCSGLKTIYFNASNCTVTGNGSNSPFYQCYSLTTLNIGSNVTNIPDYAFYGCTGLKKLIIEDGTGMLNFNYSNSTSPYESNVFTYVPLDSVYLGRSISFNNTYDTNTAHDLSPFYQNTKIKSLIIGNSVTSIGNSAFANCSGLTSVNFNATNCTTMGSSSYPVFSGCTNLTTLNLGSNVTNIPAAAFYNCSGLTGALNIPNTVATIGAYAFAGCNNLTSVINNRNAPQVINANVFSTAAYQNAILYVPSLSYSAYLTSAGWQNFNNIMPMNSATGVTLSNNTLTLNVGQTATLVATVLPANATNQSVTWSSSNNGVATVSNGTVTAVSAGSAVITATTIDGGFTATCAVTVTNTVTGVSLNKSATTLAVGSYEQLTATITPTTATNQNVSWTSSNTNIVTVSSTGLITAISAGAATITVTTQDGGKTATCTVTVTQPVTGVSLNKSATTLSVGSYEQLTATITPATATNQNVSWTSSNSNIVTVSNTGLITAISAGVATITVTTQDGNKTATCAVTVNNVMRTISAWGMPAAGGTVSGSGSYPQSSSHTVTATPSTGYAFINWLENGAAVSTNPSYTFTITGDRTLVAVFYQTDVDLTNVNVDDQTGITVIPDSISALVAWNTNANATGYTLVIYGNAAKTAIVCSLEFDAIGRLLGITFGSAASPQMKKVNGSSDVIGIRVTSLSENTTYYFQMQTIGTNETVIDTKTGEFTTTGSGAGINNILADNIKIYPNPVRDYLRFTNYDLRINKIEILDLAGKIILNSQLSILNSINVAHLASGIYFIKIQTDKGMVTRKFVKE